MKKIRVVLKPGKDKPIRAFHPWIFSGAIDLLDDNFKTGDLVKVYSKQEEFIVDRYGDYLVTQFLTAGMDALKPVVMDAMKRAFGVKGIYERDDSEARRLEGLEETLQTLSGDEPPDYVEIEEYGNRFLVDI